MGVKSCDNCRRARGECIFIANPELKRIAEALVGGVPCDWKPIECPNCGGALSELRFHRGKSYRHCYSCHFEYYKEETE